MNAIENDDDSGSDDVRRGRRATPGRASERNLLYSAVDALVARRAGGVVVIEGEPGMGKSHLLSDLAARTGREHGEGALILVVDAAVENAADPLAVWRPAVLRAARMLLRDVAPPAEAKPDVTADVLIALLPEELRWARAALERVLMPPDERKVADTSPSPKTIGSSTNSRSTPTGVKSPFAASLAWPLAVMMIGPTRPAFVLLTSWTCEWYIQTIDDLSLGPGPESSGTFQT